MENICFEKVNFTYALGDRPALNDVSFSVKEGEMCLGGRQIDSAQAYKKRDCSCG